MLDFVAARRMMVDGQVRTNDVTDLRLIDAMLDTPRERFLPPQSSELAYLDRDLSIDGRALLKPMVLAKLIHTAEIGPADRVLDVGCATGYSSALLARLAGQVVALEQDSTLAAQARNTLAGLGLTQVEIVTGPLADGYAARAPYDVILLNGRTEAAPDSLCRQLADGGRLVCVEGSASHARAMLYLRDGDTFSSRALFGAAAPLLNGFAKPPVFVF